MFKWWRGFPQPVRIATGIQEMPTEITQHIFQDPCLERKDLLAISGSCKFMHDMVEPVLYSTLHEIGVNCPDPTTIPLLLKTLLDRPELGHHFKNVTFSDDNGYDFPPNKWNPAQDSQPLTNSHWTKIESILQHYLGTKAVLEASQMPNTLPPTVTPAQIAKTWIETMSKKDKVNFRFFAALLLFRMPNVETLNVLYYEFDDTVLFSVLNFASTLQRVQQPTLEQAPYTLSRLREISMTNKSIGISVVTPSRLVWFLQMPTLRSFTTDGLESNGLVDHNLKTSQIRNLTLSNCYVPLEQFTSLLSGCRNLTTLIIGYSPEFDRPSSSLPDLTILINSIPHLHNSLEHLHFVKCRFDSSPNLGEFPSLTQFRNLRTLSINGDAFLLPDSSRCRQFDFSDLPPNLEQLSIRNPRRAEIASLLSKNLTLLSFEPNLKGIHLEIHVGMREDGTPIEIPIGGYHPGHREDAVFVDLSNDYAKYDVRMSFEFEGYPNDEHTGGRSVYVYDFEGEDGFWKRALLKRHIMMVTQAAVAKIASQSLEISLDRPPSRTFCYEAESTYSEDYSD